MNELSERRLAENELTFSHINAKNKARQQQDATEEAPLLLDCYCECSNRRCYERIQLTAETYEEIHKDNRRFIALPGHENNAIEEVVGQRGDFNIIQKYTDPIELVKGHRS